MNRIILIGNLTRDPDLSETPNGTSVCRFNIAVNRSYTSGDGERQADFFNVTAWRGTGESIAKYCKKGSRVAVTGSVQIRNYEDNNGQKRTTVDVVAQEVEFLTQKSATANDEFYEHPTERQGDRKKPAQCEMQVFDDDGDIPF